MGLAEPRRRVKIAHDPRNLAWSNSTNSYGQRLMQQQGWKSGDALGANGSNRKYADSEAAKVVVKYKDDTLGLGAKLRSKDVAQQRTGFDAFQGLLGRLNAKTEGEVQAVEKKMEDKKLAMFAQGRWGGMVFVPGGLLVQKDPYQQKLELEQKLAEQKAADRRTEQEQQDQPLPDTDTEKAQRRAEKKQRKEERRLQKEQKRMKQDGKERRAQIDPGLPTPDPSSSNEGGHTSEKKQRGQKRSRSPGVEKPAPQSATTSIKPKSGRHLLRGKNILAKRAAFADTKGLDEIFMRAA